jgi:hypothetical protein
MLLGTRTEGRLVRNMIGRNISQDELVNVLSFFQFLVKVRIIV